MISQHLDSSAPPPCFAYLVLYNVEALDIDLGGQAVKYPKQAEGIASVIPLQSDCYKNVALQMVL